MKNCNTNCSFVIKILYGVNILRPHLKFHNINEYLGSLEKLEIITQRYNNL